MDFEKVSDTFLPNLFRQWMEKFEFPKEEVFVHVQTERNAREAKFEVSIQAPESATAAVERLIRHFHRFSIDDEQAEVKWDGELSFSPLDVEWIYASMLITVSGCTGESEEFAELDEFVM